MVLYFKNFKKILEKSREICQSEKWEPWYCRLNCKIQLPVMVVYWNEDPDHLKQAGKQQVIRGGGIRSSVVVSKFLLSKLPGYITIKIL